MVDSAPELPGASNDVSKKRADAVVIPRPAAGELRVVDIERSEEVIFDFPLDSARIIALDVDIIIYFSNNAKLLLPNLGLLVAGPNPPMLTFDGRRVFAQQLLSMVADVTLTDQTATISTLQDDTKSKDSEGAESPRAVSENYQPAPVLKLQASRLDEATLASATAVASQNVLAPVVQAPTVPATSVASGFSSNANTGSDSGPGLYIDPPGNPGPLLATLYNFPTSRTEPNPDATGAYYYGGTGGPHSGTDPTYAAQSEVRQVTGTTAGDDRVYLDDPKLAAAGSSARKIVISLPSLPANFTPKSVLISGYPDGFAITNGESLTTGQLLPVDEGLKTVTVDLSYLLPSDGAAVDANGFYSSFRIKVSVTGVSTASGVSVTRDGYLQLALREVTNAAQMESGPPGSFDNYYALWTNPPGSSVDLGAGDDTVYSSAGADTMEGGSGNDTLDYSRSQSAVSVNLGARTASGGFARGDLFNNFENLVGTKFADKLTGSSANNIFNGNGGADTIDGGDGSDTVDYSASTVGISLDLNNQGAQIYDGPTKNSVIKNIENVIGSANQKNYIGGNEHDNYLVGGTKSDTFLGSSGHDTYIGNGGSNLVDFQNFDDDVLLVDDNADTTLTKLQHLDGISAVYGAVNHSNTLILGNGVTSVIGGARNDVIQSGSGNDSIDAGEGDDSLRSASGNDTIIAGSGNDTIEAGTGSDSIVAGDGNDSYVSNGGIDTFEGGAGFDIVSYQKIDVTGFRTGLIADLDANNVQVNDRQISLLSNVEAIRGLLDRENQMSGLTASDYLEGGNQNDTFIGTTGTADNPAHDTIIGNGGNADLLDYRGVAVGAVSGTFVIDLRITDTEQEVIRGLEFLKISSVENVIGVTKRHNYIIGDSANNLLRGGDGDDTIAGGAGADTLQGNSGANLLDYSTSAGGVTIDLGLTTALSGGDAQGDVFFDFSSVKGSQTAANYLIGTATDNTILGGDANDTIIGNGGFDSLDGGAGINTVNYSNAANGVTVQLFDTGSIGLGGAAQGTIRNFQNVIGALAGANSLAGNSFDNSLQGGNLNDTLTGGLGNDTLDGGGGLNFVDYSYRQAGGAGLVISLSIGGGAATVTLDLNDIDVLSNISGLRGTSGDDAITLSGAVEHQIDGGLGNDTIEGGTTNDTLIGGDAAGSDFDVVSYRDLVAQTNIAGSDIVTVDLTVANRRTLYGFKVDSIIGFEGVTGALYASNNLVGNQVANLLVGGNFADSIYGDRLADTISGGLGNDTLDGGGDINDISRDLLDYSYAASGVSADLALGKVTAGLNDIDTISNFEDILGSSQSDTLNGSAGDNYLSGGGGNDQLRGAGGNDTLDGGAQNDVVDYSYSNVGTSYYVDGSILNVSISSSDQDLLINIEGIIGGSANDTFVGSAIANNFSGGAGNDLLVGGLGATDSLDGGTGTDTLDYSGQGIDGVTLTLGGANLATAYIGSGSVSKFDLVRNIENVIGSEGSDKLQGANGVKNIFMGRGGNDTLIGNIGDDDFVDYRYANSTSAAGITLTLGQVGPSLVSIGLNDVDQISGFNNIYTADANDSITASQNANFVDLGAGSDTLVAGTAADAAGNGNDTFIGGNNAGDLIDYSYATWANGITISLGLDTGTTIKIGTNDTDVVSGFKSILSGGGADSLTGDGDANLISGGDGSDTIRAGGGADTVSGGVGNDSLDGGSGVNTLDYSYLSGGTGVTVVLSTTLGVNGFASVSVTDQDTITNFRNVIGSRFDDSISMDTADNTVVAGAGNDTISGGFGNDSLDGGDGFDIVDYSYLTAGARFNFFSGNSSILLTQNDQDTLSNIEGLIGGRGNDTIQGDDNSNFLGGGAGNDSFLASGGADTYDGGAGYDMIDYRASNIEVIAVDLTQNTIDAKVNGVTKKDYIYNIERIFASTGGDTVKGDDSDNYIFGAAGNDTIDGGLGNDTLEGGDGNDSLIGGPDTISGAQKDDDLFLGGNGNDTMVGGAANNTLSYEGVTFGISAAAVVGTGSVAKIGTGWADQISNIRNLTGGSANDTLLGDGQDNSLSGGKGNDSIIGGTGNDTVSGGAGNDTLIAGADTAGTGDAGDLLDYSYASSLGNYIVGITWVMQAATSQITIAVDDIDTVTGFRNIIGSQGNDCITGDSQNNYIAGGDGFDTISGGLGNDTLVGGLGDVVDYSYTTTSINYVLNTSIQLNLGANDRDIISGFTGIRTGSAADFITGNSDDNYIDGGAGGDAITGGLGNDTIIGGLGNDTLDGGGDIDTVDYSYVTSAIGLTIALNGSSGIFASVGTTDRDSLVNFENVIGTKNDDSIFGDSNNNTLIGSTGNDTIRGGFGNDSLSGGNDAGDLVDYSYVVSPTAGVSLVLGAAINTVNLSPTDIDTVSGFENFIGGSGNDTVVSDSRANRIILNGGDDVVVVQNDSTGLDFYDGGDGFDTLDFSQITDGPVSVVLNAGTLSTFYIQRNGVWTVGGTFQNFERVIGTQFDDQISALDGGSHTLFGGAGNDIIIGGSGNDSIDGGTGADTMGKLPGVISDDAYVVDNANDLINDSLGADTVGTVLTDFTLSGTGVQSLNYIGTDYFNVIGDNRDNTIDATRALNNSTLIGLGGNDILRGGSGNDLIDGGADNDYILGGLGNDVLIGGSGSDTVDYSYVTTTLGLTLSLDPSLTQTVNLGLNDVDTVSGFENVIGTKNNDSIVGTNDIANFIRGGDGNDTLIGSTGPNTSGGLDIVDYSYATNGISLILNGVVPTTVSVSATDVDLVQGFQGVYGGAGNDCILGGVENNWFRGGGGNDTLDADGGLNTLDYAYLAGGLGVTVNLATGTAYVSATDQDQIANFQNLVGSQFNDLLIGNAAGNSISGGAGNDTLAGGVGNDTLDGGSGSDAVDYSYRTDSFTLDLSNISSATPFTVSVAPGDVDVLSNIEGIFAGAGNDSILGTGAANFITGGGGNNTIRGGDGNDTLDGGTGPLSIVDYSYVTAGFSLGLAPINSSVYVQVSVGVNDIDQLRNFEGVYGGRGNDTIIGDTMVNYIVGGIGNDSLDGGTGLDTLDYSYIGNVDYGAGGIANGVSVVLNGVAAVAASVTSFDIDSIRNFERVVGSRFADTIGGDTQANTISGGLGNDSLDGDGGIDTLDFAYAANGISLGIASLNTVGLVSFYTLSLASALGTESDIITNFEIIQGAGGNDTIDLSGNTLSGVAFTLLGGAGNDCVIGGAGNDSVVGGTGADTLSGGAGNDTIDGSDSITGNKGIDFADYSYVSGASGVVVTLTGAGGTGSVSLTDVDTLRNIENVRGSNSADTITGDVMDNTLFGNGGDDSISAGAGNDSIGGGIGNDTLSGGAGNDTIDGGDGLDVLNLSYLTTGISLRLSGATTSTISISTTDIDTVQNIEGLLGGSGADTLIGDTRDNFLGGGAGNDSFIATIGADTIDGGAGTDAVSYSALMAQGYTVSLVSSTATSALIRVGDVNGSVLNNLVNVESITGLVFGSPTSTTGVSINFSTFNAGLGLITGGGNDTIIGGLGVDTIQGGLGNDSIDGGGGTYNTVDYSYLDTIRTSGISVAITGGSVLNTVTLANGGSYGTEVDTLININGIIGTKYNDTLIDNSPSGSIRVPNFYIFGGAGDDLVRGGFGSSAGKIYDGGDGVDTLDMSVYVYGMTIALGEGTAVGSLTSPIGLTGGTITNFENLVGGTGDDLLIGNSGDNNLNGGAANDTLRGGLGSDTLDGGTGANTADYSYLSAIATTGISIALSSTGFFYTTNQTLPGVTDTDYLVNIQGVIGTNYADTLIGANSGGFFAGGAGNDSIRGGTGNDTIQGGADNDTLDGGAGTGDVADYSYLTAGQLNITAATATSWSATVIAGGVVTEVDTLSNFEGLLLGTSAVSTNINLGVMSSNLVLTAGSGVNTITLGSGNDYISVANGASGTINGGAGNDTLYAGNTTGIETIIMNGQSGTMTFSNATSPYASIGSPLNFSNFEFLWLGNTNSGTANAALPGDRFVGSATTNNISVYGWGGADTMDDGGGSNMTFHGHADSDTYFIRSATTSVADIYFGTGWGFNNTINTTLDSLDLSNVQYGNGNLIQNLNYVDATLSTYANGWQTTGGSGNFTGIGNALNNVITGGFGNDSLAGGSGNDTIDGGAGNDVIKGGDATSGGHSTTNLIQGTAYWTTTNASFTNNTNVGLAPDNSQTAILMNNGTLGGTHFVTLSAAAIVGSSEQLTIYLKNPGGASGTRYAQIAFNTSTNANFNAGTWMNIDLGNTASVSGTLNGLANGPVVASGTNGASYQVDYDSLTGWYKVTLVATGLNFAAGAITISPLESNIASLQPSFSANNKSILVWSPNLVTLDGADSLNGGSGNDTIMGGPGNDTMDGGIDFDVADYSYLTSGISLNMASFSGTAYQAVTIAAGDIDQVRNFEGLIGGSGNDTLTGDAIANYLGGGAGNDSIFGGDGNDTLVGGLGNDTLDGGLGNDTLDYSSRLSGTDISLVLNGSVQATAFIGTTERDTFSNIENIMGGAGNDTLVGDSNANFLSGGAGNDLFIGGLGNDTIDGGLGNDTLDYSSRASGTDISLTLNGALDATAFIGSSERDIVRNIENILGGAGNDTLTGDSNANFLSGGDGNDLIFGGGAGADTLWGGNGNDIIQINRDNLGLSALKIDGGAGNDTLSFLSSQNYTGANLAAAITNVEVLDFRAAGVNVSVSLTSAQIASMAGLNGSNQRELWINTSADNGDIVDLSGIAANTYNAIANGSGGTNYNLYTDANKTTLQAILHINPA